MLDLDELQLLSRWCRSHRMHWQPGVDDDGRPAVLLFGAPGHGGVMLLPEDAEWRLLDQPGEVLAAASGLAELLDALDAGVDGAPAQSHWDVPLGMAAPPAL